MTEAETVADVLDGFVQVSEDAVPDTFKDFVFDQITRPSPTPAEPLEARVSRIESQLGEILDLLRGKTE